MVDRSRFPGRAWRRSRPALAGLLAVAAAFALGVAATTVGAVFTGTRDNGSNSFTAAAAFDTYSQAVLADSPEFYHRLNEGPATTTMDDASSNNRDGVYADSTVNIGDYRVAGKLDLNTAVHFGGVDEYVTTQTGIAGPDTFSVELWFKSTSTSGGKLIGFGNRKRGLSNQNDRHLYLDSGGRVTFGVYNGGTKTIRSTSALNDGNWHHVVGTLDGGTDVMKLYVDNVAQGAGLTGVTGGDVIASGYWRVGGDETGAWPNQPASHFVDATIDEAAVYTTALTSTQVGDHYTDGSGTATNYYNEVRSESPYLYWRLDFVQGQLADDSSIGGTNDGFMHLSPALLPNGSINTADQWTGDANNAANTFNGASGYVAQDTAVADDDTFSVELWFKSTSSAGGKLAGFGNNRTSLSTVYDRDMYLDSAGKVTFRVLDGTNKTVTSNSALNDGTWKHVVATLDGTTLRMYVNGTLQTQTVAAAGGDAYAAGYWRVGGDELGFGGLPDTPASDYLYATIDEFAVYDSALSSTRVTAHWNQRFANGGTSASYYNEVIAEANLYLYWRLGENGAQRATDSDAGGRHGSYLPQLGALGGSGTNNGFVRFSGLCTLTGASCGGAGGLAAHNGGTSPPYAAPSGSTVEVWFKTVTTMGGKLAGFGSAATGSSGAHDRNLYMLDDGRLAWGIWNGTSRITVTTDGSYNDGNWHHAVGVHSGGLKLYVDGVLKKEDATVNPAGTNTGYWRLGGDNLSGWPSAPSSYYFAGWMDEIAVWHRGLSDARIKVHYNSRNR